MDCVVPEWDCAVWACWSERLSCDAIVGPAARTKYLIQKAGREEAHFHPWSGRHYVTPVDYPGGVVGVGLL